MTLRSLLLSLLPATLLVACGSSAPDTRAEARERPPGAGEAAAQTVPVEVAPVEQREMVSLYSTSATLRAAQYATVTARGRGVLEQLEVEEGDWVQAGQVLARLEDDEQEIEKERTQAILETRQWEFERTRQLFEQELVAEEEFESARRNLREAEQAAALASLALSRTEIRAPFSGIVLRRHLDVGNTVADGTAVYDVADVDPLEADVDVPERHVARLSPGQQVRLTADASGEEVTARIDRIAPGVDRESGTVKVTLAVRAAASLRPGSFVRVDIVTAVHPDALVVPRRALVAEGQRWYLFRVPPGGGEVDRLEVSLGFEESDRVEVLSPAGVAPLAPGELVVVAGAGALSDGSPVAIVDSAPADVGT